LSGQIPHPRSSRLTAVGLRENNCVFRLRQSSGAQFYLFHSAAPNFKREPTATAVVGRKASREILTVRMCQRICDANATRTDSGQVWNGMHLRYGGQRLFWQRDPQSRSDNQAHRWRFSSAVSEERRQGDGDTRSACALPRRRLFAGTYDALLKRRQSLASKALRPEMGERRSDSTPDRVNVILILL
jgi:hypothetical protein